MPSKVETWNKCKKLGLDKKLGLKYSMTKEQLEKALTKTHKKTRRKYKRKPKKTVAPKKIKPIVEEKEEKPPETKPEPEEENVFKSVKESDYVVPEEHVTRVATERPVVRPTRQPVDPELQDAARIFTSVAEEIEPRNSMTWAKWWATCRVRLARPDSEKIQAFMRKWVKKHYELTV